MKNFFVLVGVILITLCAFTSNAQLTISQSLVPPSGVKVGDTLTVQYKLTKGTIIKNPRYLWFRYQFNNKALTYLSTTFNQGTSAQTFYTGWSNYRFNPNAGGSDSDLSIQYGLTPWAYVTNADWNVGQLTVQRADASISGTVATQKYILKDKSTYDNILKIDLATGTDVDGSNLGTIYGGGWSSLTTVTGNTSQFKVKVLFPQGYPIADHSVQLMKLTASKTIDWTQQPIAVLPLDVTGEAVFTTQVKVGDEVGVFVAPAYQKSWMNNIVTVSDAYKAFLGISQTDISGIANFFTLPVLEKRVGLVTKQKSEFSESDSYYLFAYVMGIDVTANAMVPTSTSTSIKWSSGLLNQGWLDGTVKNNVSITQPIQEANAVFTWGGDLNWSHSSDPAIIASMITAGQYTNSAKAVNLTPMMYKTIEAEKAILGITSTLVGGKVILTTTLTKQELAGLQVIMSYDESKLTLDDVVFDTGSTITNFSTHDKGRLTFGSMDQLKTSRIKVGTPYKLIFTPKVSLTNTAGLFYFVLSDAVDAKGNKIDLVIE